MWASEQLKNAANVLWEASASGSLVRVCKEDGDYLMVNETSYTDELYMEALETLIKEKKLIAESEKDSRISFRRAQ